jgi:soluble lytic murein transglycosylase
VPSPLRRPTRPFARRLPPLALLALLSAAGHLPARAAPAVGGTAVAVAELGRGYRSYRAGDYAVAAGILAPLVGRELRNQDWVLYLLGESEFYAGHHAAARDAFERLQRMKTGSRAVEIAPWRVADCLWAQDDRARAGAAYARLLKHPGGFTDVPVARFRLAELAEARNPAEARRLWMALHQEFPSSPLAEEALRRAAPPKAAAPPALAPQERLKRADTLAKERHWSEALEELDRLPAELPGPLGADRDYQIGMTKFQMRRDYQRAGELLLRVEPLLTGDRAASAAFHGARALSRVDRDNEAIAGYRRVVARYPQSRYAAEAQYLSGWLEFNRGRFRESLDGLQATLDHFGKSAFADDAAWCLAFAHYLLGEADQAASGFDRYLRLPSNDMSAEERRARVDYWRARLREKAGQKDQARAGYLELFRRGPLSFYGLLARARLEAAGEKDLAPGLADGASSGATAPPVEWPAAGADPTLARIDELLEAGMQVEAGWELERNEGALLHRLGERRGLALLLDRYRRANDFHRAFRLAQSHGGDALGLDPEPSQGKGEGGGNGPAAGARLLWEAAYPKAFADLVDKYGPAAGNPDLFLYAIMRKESAFSPQDVSYADARGLLQMIPPTSAKVAAAAAAEAPVAADAHAAPALPAPPFFPDQLYQPETNVRLGAAYIGSLYRKFGRQIPLAAGAYNAGPKAMGRWCQQHGQHPMDEFVELIAFAQTREYVKRVVGIYAHYRYLYGPTPYEIPLTVDAKFRPDGPDY